MCLVPTIGKHFRACARVARRAHQSFIGRRDSIKARCPKYLRNTALVGALFSPVIAQAGVMTIDFPQDVAPSATVNNGNGVADGFRISPSSEYTLVAPGGDPPGLIAQGIGWDSDGLGNQHYLGSAHPPHASLFVDNGGTPFSLLDVTFIAAGLDDNFMMTSSKGGVFDVPAHLDGTLSMSFDGSLWTGIDWLTFSYFDAGAPTAGLDQLVVAVDEPQTLAMVGFGFLLFLGLQRMPVRARRSH